MFMHELTHIVEFEAYNYFHGGKILPCSCLSI